MHFCSSICMKDNWSLYVGVDASALEHSIPGQGKYGHSLAGFVDHMIQIRHAYGNTEISGCGS